MRRVSLSRTYIAQVRAGLEEGVARFGVTVARRTLQRIDRTIEHLAHFPASKPVDIESGLTFYPVSRTPFALLYDFDDVELRIYFLVHASSDRTQIDPNDADW